MTQANQIKKNDDFKLVIVFRIEGQNSRAFMFRILGIVAAMIAVTVKIVSIVLVRAP
jgi:hypothetical protein